MVDVNELLFPELNLLGVGMRHLFLLQRRMCLCLSGYLVFLCSPRWKSHRCQSSCQMFSRLQSIPEFIFQRLWGFAPLFGMGWVPLCLCLIPWKWFLERSFLGTESKGYFASPPSSCPRSFDWGREQSLHLLTSLFLCSAHFLSFQNTQTRNTLLPPQTLQSYRYLNNAGTNRQHSVLCLVVAQQRGRRGAIVCGWEMPFLARQQGCCSTGRQLCATHVTCCKQPHQGTILLG